MTASSPSRRRLAPVVVAAGALLVRAGLAEARVVGLSLLGAVSGSLALVGGSFVAREGSG